MTAVATPTGPAEGRGLSADAVHPLIHEAVTRHAQQRPEATAIVFRDERIVYRTLDAAADAYARQLADRGVGPGRVVPVQLPRSPELVATLLAVLKCGAAYAALDHRWSAERVDGLLDQLCPPVFVTRGRSSHAQQSLWRPPAEALAATAEQGGRAPYAEINPTAPACVFFTSGTTGTPKGVVSPHQATTRLFRDVGGLAGFRSERVTAQSAPCAWDAFNLELWGVLTTGGATVIVEDDYLLPGTLRDVVKSAGVDTVWLTASLFNLFVDMDLDCFEGVRDVYTGGERLSAAHIRRFLERYPSVPLFNGYGPVESCVFATVRQIGLGDCDTPGGIPIGGPAPATDVYVLDGVRPCEPGVEGEICVGGAGLATGYLGQPDLTAEKFVDVAPYGPAVRVYRTGDLGFQDAEGVLHFRGRADRQVKVRGFRIELGEIESATMKIEGVRRCTVVPVPGRIAAWERLALFYTADLPADSDGDASDAVPDSLDPLQISRRLAESMPAYLVPDTVRVVAELPMSENGKIDNKVLLSLLPS